MRDSYRSVADASGIQTIVPVAKGGFGSNNAEEAAAAIAAASSFMLGEPNGYAKLGSNGKLPVAALPTPTSYPTLSGPTEVLPGSINTYRITNHIQGASHTASVNLGQVAIVEDVLTLTAPALFEIIKLTLDGREIFIPITSVKPKAPVLYSTEEGESPLSQKIQMFVSDYMETSPGLGALEVQVDTTTAFTGSTNYIFTGAATKYFEKLDVLENTVYYVRARFIDKYEVASDWSLVKTFRIGAFWTEARARAMLNLDGGSVVYWCAYGYDKFLVITSTGVMHRITKSVDGKWNVVKVGQNMNTLFDFFYGSVGQQGYVQGLTPHEAVVMVGTKLAERGVRRIVIFFPDTGKLTIQDEAKTIVDDVIGQFYGVTVSRSPLVAFTYISQQPVTALTHVQLLVYDYDKTTGLLVKKLSYPANPADGYVTGTNKGSTVCSVAVSDSGQTIAVAGEGDQPVHFFKRTPESGYYAYSGSWDVASLGLKSFLNAITLLDDATLTMAFTPAGGSGLTFNTYALGIIPGSALLTSSVLLNSFNKAVGTYPGPPNHLYYRDVGFNLKLAGAVRSVELMKFVGNAWSVVRTDPLTNVAVDPVSRSFITPRGSAGNLAIVVYE